MDARRAWLCALRQRMRLFLPSPLRVFWTSSPAFSPRRCLAPGAPPSAAVAVGARRPHGRRVFQHASNALLAAVASKAAGQMMSLRLCVSYRVLGAVFHCWECNFECGCAVTANTALRRLVLRGTPFRAAHEREDGFSLITREIDVRQVGEILHAAFPNVVCAPLLRHFVVHAFDTGT